MSYGRDPDASTRHPGAIASRDKAHPTKAVARARARARVLARSDRALSHLTLDARGGLALGMVSRTNSAIIDRVTSPTVIKTAGTTRPTTFPSPTTVAPTTTTVRPPGTVIKLPTGTTSKLSATSFAPTLTRLPVKTTATPAPVIADPIRVPVSSPSAPKASVPVKTSQPIVGGGSGGVWSGGKKPPVALPPLPPSEPLPDIPEEGSAPASGSKGLSNGAKLAILGAAAGAAYLLVRNRGNR